MRVRSANAGALERRAGLAQRRERIEARAKHLGADRTEVALALNGYGRLVPRSCNAGSRGARRAFGRPASAYDEPLVAATDGEADAREERALAVLVEALREAPSAARSQGGETPAAPSDGTVAAGPGVAKTRGE